jgi:hypothetical protein
MVVWGGGGSDIYIMGVCGGVDGMIVVVRMEYALKCL